MDIVLEGNETFCTASINDILIYSSTGAKLIGHVNEVLGVLEKYGLTAKHLSVSGEWRQWST